jgi:arylsulfatase A-like enzyme
MPLPSPAREGLSYRFPVGPLLWGIQLLDNSPPARVIRRRLNASSPFVRHYKRVAYERTLIALDRAFLSRLMQRVDHDNTVVAILGDHGEFVDPTTDTIPPHMNLYRYPAHGFHVYEYLTRVPFLLCGPGISPRRIDTLSNQTDIAPALLGALGLPHDADAFDGRDLAEGKADDERPVFMEAVGGGNLEHSRYVRAVRTEDWKFAEAPWTLGFKEELYNLARDPLERHNLRQERPEVAEQLRQMLSQHFAEDGDSPGAQYSEETRMSEEEQAAVEGRLRRLGYID